MTGLNKGFNLRERYFALHGLAPERVFEHKMRPEPQALVDLGPVDKICYRKKIFENGRIKRPRYCHDFGEHWPAELLDELAPILSRDENGGAHLLPQQAVDTSGQIRDATFITDHGYEDLPMSSIRSTQRSATARYRLNPASLAAAHTRPAVSAVPVSAPQPSIPTSLPAASTQFYSYGDGHGSGYTQVRVTKVGPVGIMARHVAAGSAGALLAPAISRFLLDRTSLSAAHKAMLLLGAASLAGVGVASRFPRLGAGIALGGIAVSAIHGLQALSEALTEPPSAPIAPVTAPAPTAPPAQPMPPSGYAAPAQFQPFVFAVERGR